MAGGLVMTAITDWPLTVSETVKVARAVSMNADHEVIRDFARRDPKVASLPTVRWHRTPPGPGYPRPLTGAPSGAGSRSPPGREGRPDPAG